MLDDLGAQLWDWCIRPAARYDRWLPWAPAADDHGCTQVAVTPVFTVRGRRCIVSYWTDGQAEVWQVAVEVDDETAITQIFGDAHGPPEVVLWDWEGDEPAGDWDEGNAVLACPTPWADEQQMSLLF